MPEPLPTGGDLSSTAGKSLSTTLLVRLQANEDGAWRRLDHLYGPVVLGWGCGAGLRPEDAADVRQEVFRAMAGAMADFRRDGRGDSFRGWLWRITQNKLRDFFRRQRRQPAAAGGTTFQQRLQEVPLDDAAGDESQPPGPSDEETGGIFRRALELVRSEFADNTWQAFWRVTIDGQSPADVAAALGMSAGAVYVAKSRVLRRLREEFGDLLQ
jgi:RNA polymerase sigma-70 factor (ECF subfamily)